MKKNNTYRPISVMYYNKNDVAKYSTSLASYMSNRKWYKLFDFIHEHFDRTTYMELQLVWEQERTRRLFYPRGLDYYEVGLEGITEGFRRWCMYDEIEWIQFPKEYFKEKMNKISHQYEMEIAIQDLNPIIDILSKRTFQLDIEIEADYLRIYGYRRR